MIRRCIKGRVPTPYVGLGRGRFETCPYGTVSSWAHDTIPNTLSGVALGTLFAMVKTKSVRCYAGPALTGVAKPEYFESS